MALLLYGYRNKKKKKKGSDVLVMSEIALRDVSLKLTLLLNLRIDSLSRWLVIR